MTPLTPEQRQMVLATFVDGITSLEQALADAPEQWLDVRPSVDEWSIREIVVHCADMELMSSVRCRMLMAEPETLIAGIDPDIWAAAPGYQGMGIVESMAVIRSTRLFTVQILAQMPEHMWENVGHHSESGSLPLFTWLSYFANHLDVHAMQIRSNIRILESSNWP
ncbi:MAG: DinB family protein [Thermomicrobiales bacterium]